MATVSAHELFVLRNSGPLDIIDVRSESEYATAHIPGAKCIPLEQLNLRRADLGEGDVVLVCETGMRASMAHRQLVPRNGRTLLLEGGTRAWRSAGLPVVTPLRTGWSLERQVRLCTGLLILAGAGLTLLISPVWVLLPAFIGAGLTFAGATNVCMLGRLLARMKWNQPRSIERLPACSH